MTVFRPPQTTLATVNEFFREAGVEFRVLESVQKEEEECEIRSI